MSGRGDSRRLPNLESTLLKEGQAGAIGWPAPGRSWGPFLVDGSHPGVIHGVRGGGLLFDIIAAVTRLWRAT